MRALSLGVTTLAMMIGLLADTARADGPYTYRPPGATMSIYDWTGIYVGGQAGAAYTKAEWAYGLDSLDQTQTGFAGGAHVGLQKQWSNTVLGLEVAYIWSDWEQTSGSPLLANTSLTSDVSNLLLVTGKVGYAWENAVAFAKGGYATADVDFRTSVTSTGVVLTSSSGREHGWTAGVGVDYALTPHIIIGVEYDYVRLNVGGRDQIATPAGLAGTNVFDAGIDIQMLMARLSFKFGPRPEQVPIK